MAKSEKVTAFATHSPNVPTGFGRVNREVSCYLGNYYKHYCVGWQFSGEPLVIMFQEEPKGGNFLLCPTAPGGNYNEFGQRTFPQFIPYAKPDLLITLADWFVFAGGAHNGFINYGDRWLPNFLRDSSKQMNQKIHNVWYFPIDSTPINNAFKRLLEITEVPVVMSRFGSKELNRLGIDHEYIPHGVRPTQFKINNEQNKIKARQDVASRYMKHPLVNKKVLKNINDAFIIVWGGRNQIRKMPQLLVEVCGKFAKDKEDVLFIFHTSPVPYEVGFTLPFHMERYEFSDRVLFTEASQVYHPASGFLNNLMNCGDVYLDTAGGEGFGFFRLEAAACGLARVLVNWSTSAELMGLKDEDIPIDIDKSLSVNRKDGTVDNIKTDMGFLVPPITKWTSGVGADFGLVDIDLAVEALNYLYDHREDTRRMGIKANQFAYKNYTWDQILPQWRNLIDDIFENEVKFKAKLEAKLDSTA